MGVFLVVTTALALLVQPAAAQKVNLAYLEDAPYPIGSVTKEQIEALADSDFTHVIFAFVNFCTPDSKSARGFECPGDDAVPVWNIKAVYDANGDPFREAQAAMELLSAAGKTVFLSLGGWDNPETWDYFASSPAAAASGADRLLKFMDDYSIGGVDYDMEAGSTLPDTDGFGAVVAALTAKDKTIPMSIAPYSSDSTAADFTSVQWQYCQMARAGKTPVLINRQYYSGGFSTDIVGQMAADMQAFPCPGAASGAADLSIPVEQMNPGLGIGLTQLPPNQQPASPYNCENDDQAGEVFAQCAGIAREIVTAYPDVAGLSLWDYNGLLQSCEASYPAAYPCEIGNALNGTSNSCK
ncbi:glycoside hydrolase family 18 protein [Hoeflea ulvae]|uniref:Glycoside hydrolase family 18 protein n=1 Tax=Hoeflea ulvae TaxID=2983764 RepID=A0ABT3YGU4_9HYPH|nr:glycoside hydrolase family 18 protein [Hoeflea ulvae]MCY0094847.1 glycoside hydrolase family 18 protein [Hoeflea ulvae]